MLPLFLALAGVVLNPSSSFDRNLSLETCRNAQVKIPCVFTIEAPGYGSKKFRLYKKETNGDLSQMQEGVINPTGTQTLKVTFQNVESVNVIVMLFSTKGEPLAIDGAYINVEPDKRQLGEQVVPNLRIQVYTPPSSDDEGDNNDEGPDPE